MAGKRWNGSTWVDHTTKKRWNGSTWVDLTTAKRWNGSSWVDIYAAGGGSLDISLSSSSLSGYYFCLEPNNVCPTSKSFSNNPTYSVTGNTGAYTVVATVIGDAITVSTATPGVINVSTSCGREDIKTGEIRIVVTDTVTSITRYIPYSYEYNYYYESGE